MNVLITNDDGIHANGLQVLAEAFSDHHRVTVVAPDRERSAVGHGITLHSPLRYEEKQVCESITGYAVNGTPADCVKLALAEILPSPPDLVVSGINPGANVGININYSGTVAGAREASLAGIPAMAVSIEPPSAGHMTAAARCAVTIARQLLAYGLARGTFLNVNYPDLPLESIRGIRLSRQGIVAFDQHFDKRTDPRGRTYYWQGCDPQTGYDRSDIDGAVIADGFVSITPIRCDLTDHEAIGGLAAWNLEEIAVPREE